MLKLICVLWLPLLAHSSFAADASECQSEWKHDDGLPGCVIETVKKTSLTFGWAAKVRHGYLDANPAVPFKGNVIYLEGIADSMLNHRQLFKSVTDQGYRMIAWDLEGQGGSPGRWGKRSLLDMLTIADAVYTRDAIDSGKKLKVLMGWSIGGINGYAAAAGLHPIKPDAVILLAPSIAARPTHVGEGLLPKPIHEGGKTEFLLPGAFTVHSLVVFQGSESCPLPFVDPILPYTPATVPSFAVDIVALGIRDQHTTIPPTVKGLVLMSGPEDTFINGPKTKAVFAEKAPHFEIVSYPGTRHMIDAERCEVRDDIAKHVGEFLKKL